MSLLQVADRAPATEAEGPGRRFAIWLQGCPLRCPGCCNPEMLPFHGGRPATAGEVLAEIESAVWEHGIEGITLLGGEPFAQANGAAALAEEVQRLRLTVMVFSGYTLEELRGMSEPAVGELLRHINVLIDGPYIRELPETARRWIGSTNQRVHFLTGRYQADDPCWRLPNTVEIRLRGGELTFNGYPAAAAGPVGRRPQPLARWTRMRRE